MTVSKSALPLAVAFALIALSVPARADSDLMRAYKIIEGKKFVDLTHSFSPETPVWSGFGQAVFTPAYENAPHLHDQRRRLPHYLL